MKTWRPRPSTCCATTCARSCRRRGGTHMSRSARPTSGRARCWRSGRRWSPRPQLRSRRGRAGARLRLPGPGGGRRSKPPWVRGGQAAGDAGRLDESALRGRKPLLAHRRDGRPPAPARRRARSATTRWPWRDGAGWFDRGPIAATGPGRDHPGREGPWDDAKPYARHEAEAIRAEGRPVRGSRRWPPT